MYPELELNDNETHKILYVHSEVQRICTEVGRYCDVTLESLMEEYKAGVDEDELIDKYVEAEYELQEQLRGQQEKEAEEREKEEEQKADAEEKEEDD